MEREVREPLRKQTCTGGEARRSEKGSSLANENISRRGRTAWPLPWDGKGEEGGGEGCDWVKVHGNEIGHGRRAAHRNLFSRVTRRFSTPLGKRLLGRFVCSVRDNRETFAWTARNKAPACHATPARMFPYSSPRLVARLFREPNCEMCPAGIYLRGAGAKIFSFNYTRYKCPESHTRRFFARGSSNLVWRRGKRLPSKHDTSSDRMNGREMGFRKVCWVLCNDDGVGDETNRTRKKGS